MASPLNGTCLVVYCSAIASPPLRDVGEASANLGLGHTKTHVADGGLHVCSFTS
jgi:hypothetical protein